MQDEFALTDPSPAIHGNEVRLRFPILPFECRELAALEGQYREPESNFIPVYGRRRVGKSELILHFKKDRPGIYFVGKQAPAALQVREFLRTAAKALNEPLLAKADITDWRSSLSEVVQRWRG